MSFSRLFPALAILTLVLASIGAPLALAQDGGDSAEDQVGATTKAGAYAAIERLVARASDALAEGNATGASALLEDAATRYVYAFRGDFNRSSPLAFAASEDAFARLGDAVRANDSAAFAAAAAGLRDILAAGAFYAFEWYGILGEAGKTEVYFELLDDRFGLAAGPAGKSWALARNSTSTTYLDLLHQTIGRDDAHEGIFDAYLVGVAAGPVRALSALETGDATRARHEGEATLGLAAVVLPESEARAGAPAADALAAALAATVRATSAEAARAAANDTQRALALAFGNASVAALHLQAAPSAEPALALAHVDAALALYPEANATLLAGFDRVRAAIRDGLDAAEIAFRAEGLARDLRAHTPNAPQEGETPGHEHGGHNETTRVTLEGATLPVKGLTRITVPILARDIPQREGAFSGGAYTLRIAYPAARLALETVQGVWAPAVLHFTGVQGEARFSGTTVVDAKPEQVVANVTFLVTDAEGATTEQLTVEAERLVGGNGKEIAVAPAAIVLDFTRAPDGAGAEPETSGAQQTPATSVAGIALAGVAAAFAARRRRAQ